MEINGIQYNTVLTDKTPTEISQRFGTIVEGKNGFQAIEQLLSEYPHVPSFVLPYLKAIYCKSMDDADGAAEYMDEAIEQLREVDFSSIKGEVFGEATYMFIYGPFEKELWGQAGEIYSNVDRYEDALNAYKKYQRQHCCIKGDNISGGLLSFRPISKYALSDIVNNEITVCSPLEMNDPFDTLLLSWGDYHLKQKKGRKHITPYVKSMEYYRIRAFCKINNRRMKSKMLKNVLMWSHYADKHMGMCLEYHFSPSFARTEDSSRVFRFRDVIYRSDSNKLSLDTSTINTDMSLLTKHASWRYENEVRLITYIPDQEGRFVPLRLDHESYKKNIYFGMRCSERDITLVKNAITQAGMDVGLFRMCPNVSDVFHLRIEPL